MVKRIYIVKQLLSGHTKDAVIETKACQIPEPSIISIQDFANGGQTSFSSLEDGKDDNVVDVFDDPTGNFDMLGYWSSETDLDKQSSEQVLERVRGALQKLESEGVVERKLTPDEDASCLLPKWWFGTRPKPGAFHTEPLPVEDKKPILMFHLRNIEKAAGEWPRHFFLSVV